MAPPVGLLEERCGILEVRLLARDMGLSELGKEVEEEWVVRRVEPSLLGADLGACTVAARDGTGQDLGGDGGLVRSDHEHDVAAGSLDHLCELQHLVEGLVKLPGRVAGPDEVISEEQVAVPAADDKRVLLPLGLQSGRGHLSERVVVDPGVRAHRRAGGPAR